MYKNLPNIDNLPRVDIGKMKSVIKNFQASCDKVAEIVRNHPERRAEAFSILKDYYAEGNLGEYPVRIFPIIESDLLNLTALLFVWECDGEKMEQRVSLLSKGSNLPQYREKRILFFVCPYTGSFCRKLYTDGRVLAGRKAFPHTYNSRLRDKRLREFEQLFNIIEFVEHSENRKHTYRGKPTPFGLKYKRFNRMYFPAAMRIEELLIMKRRRLR